MPTPESWRKAAKEYLERERESKTRPINKNGHVTCPCECHNYCHTCSRRFIGNDIHINCGDTLGGSTTLWSNTNANQ